MTAKKNIHQRLAEAMGVVKYIQNEKKQGMQYRIVSHDKVTAKVRPALLDAGIVYYPVRCDYVQNGNRTECNVTVRFVNIDEPSDFFDVPSLGFGVDQQDKGPGKAMSYAVKYALLKALGLETGEDPDEDPNTPDHSEKDPHEPARDPRAVADKLVSNIKGADDMAKLNRVLGNKTFDAAWKWLEETKSPMALEVKSALEAKRSELDILDSAN